MNHRAQSQADGYADIVELSELAELIFREIAAVLDLLTDEVTPGGRLVDDYGATTLDLALLWSNLQDHFALRIPMREIDHWKQVADVVTYISGRIAPEAITS